MSGRCRAFHCLNLIREGWRCGFPAWIMKIGSGGPLMWTHSFSHFTGSGSQEKQPVLGEAGRVREVAVRVERELTGRLLLLPAIPYATADPGSLLQYVEHVTDEVKGRFSSLHSARSGSLPHLARFGNRRELGMDVPLRENGFGAGGAGYESQ